MIALSHSNCLKSVIGGSGLSAGEIARGAGRLGPVLRALEDQRRSGRIGFFDLPRQVDSAKKIRALAESWRGKYENFVVIGIGGSALGNIALQSALRHPHWNLLPATSRKGYLRLFVPDNIDPTLTAGLLDAIDPAKTIFNVVSKSGTTAECLANYFIVRRAVERKLGRERAKARFLFTTDPEKGYLRQTGAREGIPMLDVPRNVGGRFSVLSAVGLASAAATGVDVVKLLAGARAMERRCWTPSVLKNPAYLFAWIHTLYYKKSRPVHVMMPYSNELRDVADWFRQLWAESLGKKLDRKGRTVYAGPTPVKALGATDQHSQIQLYIEGPHDKLITFLSVAKFARDLPIPGPAGHYLTGQPLSRLFKAEEKATAAALAHAGRPNLSLTLPDVSPQSVGGILFLLQAATAMAGELMDLNAFDQPGVEQGKVLTYALMGREGYSRKLSEFRKFLK